MWCKKITKVKKISVERKELNMTGKTINT